MPLTPSASPFRLRSMSMGAYPHASWQRAHEQALAALRRGEPIAILGRPGTGKTLLLHHIAQDLSIEDTPVIVHRSSVVDDAGTTSPLLIDEADSLPLSALEKLCGRAPVFALAGLPALSHVLDMLPRTVTPITLLPLQGDEIARFVVSRLKESGRPATTFEPEAIVSLATHSAGLLRLVVALAGSALFLAEQEGGAHVTQHHVEEAAALRIDVDGPVDVALVPEQAQSVACAPVLQRPASTRRYGVVAIAIAACALAGIGLWAMIPRNEPKATVATLAPVQTMSHPIIHRERSFAVIPEAEPARPLPTVLPPISTPTQATRLPDNQVLASEPIATFKGPIMNVTMQQGGQLALVIRHLQPGRINVEFRASSGLIGRGQITGTMTGDGRISASGRLMMGQNPFDCVLNAVSGGDTLTGEADFTRIGTNALAHSTFRLTRRD